MTRRNRGIGLCLFSAFVLMASLCVEEPPLSDKNLATRAVTTATPTAGTVPLTVGFDGSDPTDPDGTITGYTWDFGDGGSYTPASPSHIYTTRGAFTASLDKWA